VSVGGLVEREVVVPRDDELEWGWNLVQELNGGMELGELGTARDVTAVDDHVDGFDGFCIGGIAEAMCV
jgi:hypothetical protein